MWVLLVLLVASPRIGERHKLLVPPCVLHHRTHILDEVWFVVEIYDLGPVSLAVAAEEAYLLVVMPTHIAELLEVKNIMVLLVWVFENQTDKTGLIIAECQFAQLLQDTKRLDLVCAFVKSVGEVSFALLGEADAQVEASCAIVPLFLDCLALTPSERNHKPSIPLLRSEISH